MHRIQAEVKSVEKGKNSGWLVSMRSCSTGRELYMETSRSGYCKGQIVKLTCEKVSGEGKLMNPRFSAWVPFLYSRKGPPEKQEEILRDHLKKFQQGCGLCKSRGRVQIEGDIEVAVDKRGWFLVYRTGTKDRLWSVCHARSLAKWIVESSGCREV